jgi:hypothetical protein
MQQNKLNIEPCPDCPVPTNFIVKPGMSGDKKCLYIDCRECGDKWTETLEDE